MVDALNYNFRERGRCMLTRRHEHWPATISFGALCSGVRSSHPPVALGLPITVDTFDDPEPMRTRGATLTLSPTATVQGFLHLESATRAGVGRSAGR